jgi:hypothetical protein
MNRGIAVVTLAALVAVGIYSQRAGGAAAPSTAQTAALRAIDEASASLSQLETIHANTVQLNQKMSALYNQLGAAITKTGKVAAAPGVTTAQLMQAIQQMQETQMSFNLQYLQLQSQMQNENRQFTAVSNIMKTKHDTVKNTISNIR